MPTVLIVDDDASLRLLCRVNLELDGYNVLEAPSVAAAEDAVAVDLVDLFLLDVHIGADDGLALMRSLRDREHRAPVVLFTGQRDGSTRSRSRRPTASSRSRSGSSSCSTSCARSRRTGRFTPPMSVTPAVLSPADYESRLQRYLFERAEEGRAVRVGEKEVSERAEIVARYAELFTRDQLAGLREAESEAGRGRGARAPLPAAQDLRGGPDLRRAGRAGGRARERDPRRAGRVQGRAAAAANGPGTARGADRLRRPRRARPARQRGLGDVQRRAARRAARGREARGRRQRDRRPGRAQRGGEGHLAPRARAARWPPRARRSPTSTAA